MFFESGFSFRSTTMEPNDPGQQNPARISIVQKVWLVLSCTHVPKLRICINKDIAALAGVHIGTVEMALQNQGKVSQKSSEKVKAELRQIAYSQNPMGTNH